MPKPKVCSVCETEFTPPRHGNYTYCGDECAAIARLMKKLQMPVKYEGPKQGECADCHRPTRKYRCPSCEAKWRKKNGKAVRPASNDGL